MCAFRKLFCIWFIVFFVCFFLDDLIILVAREETVKSSWWRLVFILGQQVS